MIHWAQRKQRTKCNRGATRKTKEPEAQTLERPRSLEKGVCELGLENGNASSKSERGSKNFLTQPNLIRRTILSKGAWSTLITSRKMPRSSQ